MKFKKWVDAQGGARVVSRLLGVHQDTIYKWIREGHMPRVSHLLKLVNLSQGAFTIEDIVRELGRAK